MSLLLAMILAAGVVDAPQAPTSDGLALQAIRNFAACAVEMNADRAAALLEMDPNGEDYQPKLREYVRASSRCNLPDHKLASSSLPFAGAIAEALIAQRFASVPLEQATAVPKVPLNEVTTIGQCVSQRNPAAVTAVLHSVPGSDEEVKALNATGPWLSGCVRAGLTMTLNRVSARAIYALGAYRTYAGPPAVVTPAAEPQH